ncbi:MAG TPA: acyltransferase family protein, partial [Hyphomonadaceae bacterium]
LLAFSFLLFDETTPHPSVLTLVPVLGTALVIMFAEKGTRCAAILSWPVCVGIGLLSYSIYLWHQPLLAYARVLGNGELPAGLALLLILLSIALAGLSWRFVERPFRRKNGVRRQTVFTAAAVGTTLMIAAGTGLATYPMLFTRVFHPDRIERIEQISRAMKSEQFVMQDDCHFQSETFDTTFRETFQRCAQRYGAAIFVTGESHAIDLYNALALNSGYPFIASVSRGYCRPHEFFGGRPPYPCHYEDLKVFAAENAAHIRRIVYTQTPDRLFPNGMTNATIDDMSTEAVDQVISYLAELQQASGVKITILGMLPPLQVATQDLDVKQPLKDALAQACSPKLIDLTRQVEALWSAKADAAHLEFVSKLDAFDLHLPDDLLIEGEITYSDNRHLSRVGERVFGARLVQFLHKAGYSEF